MKIKTYVVSTLSDAVAQIKRDLGPDAVILSTRQATGKNTWWKTGKTQIEVTAALDVAEPDSKALPNPQQASFSQVLKIINQMTEDKLGNLRKELSTLKESIEQKKPVQNGLVEPEAAEKNAVSSSASTTPTAIAASPEAHAPNNVYPLLSRVQVPMDQFVRLKDGGKAALQTLKKLMKHGVDASVLQTLAYELIQAPDVNGVPDTDSFAAQWMVERIAPAAPYIAGTDPRLIALIGPTGSGKTTTLAKLASAFALEGGKKVGFVTVDAFRIGAADQLGHYASLLQAPCELVRNETELKAALEKMKDLDIVLIDTVGRSPHDAEGIAELAGILAGQENIWKAFVAPATLREEDLYESMRAYAEIDFNRIILTKLDETSRFGSLYNAAFRSEVPLAYFTTGQSVPEDIEEATYERLLDCLFEFSSAKPVAEAPAKSPAVSAFETILAAEAR